MEMGATSVAGAAAAAAVATVATTKRIKCAYACKPNLLQTKIVRAASFSPGLPQPVYHQVYQVCIYRWRLLQ